MIIGLHTVFGLLKKQVAGLLFAFFVAFNCSAFAETQVDAAQAQFAITRLIVEGNTLIPSEKLDAALKPFIREHADIDVLQAALQAVEQEYAAAGFSAIKAVLPEQEAEGGVFKISVIEAKLGQVRVIGNQAYDKQNILNSAPDLIAGEAPNLNRVGASIRIANESFAKHTQVVVAKSAHPGEVDAELRVNDTKPWRFAATLDNTGTAATGKERLSFIFQHANLFNRDHAMAAQFTTSPGREDKVKIFGISYRIPLYQLGDTIDLSYGHSDVNSGSVVTTAGTYGISGSGDFVAANYNLALPSWKSLDQRLTFSLNWHSFVSNVVLQGGSGSLIPDLTSAPASIIYTLEQSEGERRWAVSAGLTHNLPSGGNGNQAAYNQNNARPGADANFNLLRYNLAYTAPAFVDWNLHAELSGQYTTDLLISGEQFGVGGAASVRGFDERAVSGDSGYRASVELASPEWTKIKYPNSRLNSAIFADYGHVERNRPLKGEFESELIASVGAGLRLSVGQSMQVKFDLAKVLNGGGTTKNGDMKGHIQFVVIF